MPQLCYSTCAFVILCMHTCVKGASAMKSGEEREKREREMEE